MEFFWSVELLLWLLGKRSIPVPIIVRLQGTNVVEAKELIDESGLKVYSAILLKETAALVTKVLKEK